VSDFEDCVGVLDCSECVSVAVCVLVMKCQVSQSLLTALYQLNSTEMSSMLSVLPKNFQVL